MERLAVTLLFCFFSFSAFAETGLFVHPGRRVEGALIKLHLMCL